MIYELSALALAMAAMLEETQQRRLHVSVMIDNEYLPRLIRDMQRRDEAWEELMVDSYFVTTHTLTAPEATQLQAAVQVIETLAEQGGYDYESIQKTRPSVTEIQVADWLAQTIVEVAVVEGGRRINIDDIPAIELDASEKFLLMLDELTYHLVAIGDDMNLWIEQFEDLDKLKSVVKHREEYDVWWPQMVVVGGKTYRGVR